MARFLAAAGFIVCFALVGCSSGGSESTLRSSPATRTKTVRVLTCGTSGGLEFKLHGVNCYTAKAMVAILNGRALHQTLTLAWDQGHQVTWTCNSPSRSLLDRLHCQQGARFFSIERKSS